ncbi:hypothetical protein STEG23_020506, partial [Scotinomys teguina]
QETTPAEKETKKERCFSVKDYEEHDTGLWHTTTMGSSPKLLLDIQLLPDRDPAVIVHQDQFLVDVDINIVPGCGRAMDPGMVPGNS